MATHPLSDLLITRHLQWMRATGLSERNVEDRRRLLEHLDARLPRGLGYGSEFAIAEYLGNPRWSVQTKATYWGHTTGFYRWAVTARQLSVDPTVNITRPRVPQGVPRPIRNDDLTRILTEAGEPYRLWALLAAKAGLRASEIAGLDRDDVTEQRIWIRRGKGGRAAWIRTHRDVWAAVKDLPPGQLARRVTDGRPASGAYLAHAFWVHVNTQMGIKTSIHKLRHWFGTETLRASGGNVITTQKALRHKAVTSTVIYAEVLQEDVEAAVAALPSHDLR